jgi:beta-N-acetylhexosaminidase
MTDELVEMGFNVNCVPLLDIPVSGCHDIIGDRALSNDIGAIIELGRAVANGNLQGGVLPVIKHIPGHGRATADSHVNLPVIDATRQELEQSDFQTFKALNDLPLAMTGHLLMSDLDPKLNVSVSKTIIDEVIRGFIGFDGCLMSDDLSMEALSGTLGERARDVLAAGCDLALYCKGEREQMLDVAANTPELAGKAGARFTAAITCLQPPQPFDEIEAKALLARLS